MTQTAPRAAASAPLHSALYEGVVTHSRKKPALHSFTYRVAMVYLDLAELDQVFGASALWSRERFNGATFRRSDYLGDPAQPLPAAVSARILEATGRVHKGPIRMLTNLRYFGYIINPLTCYYCFDESERLQFIVAEVTNTPWHERHAYVLEMDADTSAGVQFAKALHVSPFMAMNLEYVWRGTVPDQHIAIFLANRGPEAVGFTAVLHLQRRAMTPANMRRLLWRYPLMTVQVVVGIYWQALRLWRKGARFVPHPGAGREQIPDVSRRIEP
ncbi:MAG: hypothetical protein RLZZ227_843 [Pseudomonadota bacterium]|jgi:DUF1365 family protein